MFDTQAASGGPMPRFAIFTDFDGTLVDLADTPDAIAVPDALSTEIVEAARLVDGALAVISGRELADLERYLPSGIAAAGGHGTERRRSDGSRITPAASLNEAAANVASRLREFVDGHPGLLLELKTSSVALHYRRAPDLADACRDAMAEALAAAPDFEMLEGKMVVEARPVALGKADAIRAFMNEAPFIGRVPVFLGDDVTDEDGFRAAQEMGGVGIKIGEGKTAARIRTPDVESARAIIVGLARRAAELDSENA
jgi:trehalose 6-phosphate phosphatase